MARVSQSGIAIICLRTCRNLAWPLLGGSSTLARASEHEGLT